MSFQKINRKTIKLVFILVLCFYRKPAARSEVKFARRANITSADPVRSKKHIYKALFPSKIEYFFQDYEYFYYYYYDYIYPDVDGGGIEEDEDAVEILPRLIKQ